MFSNVRNLGHFQDECPTNKSSQDEGSGPKKFEDYTYTYSGPDIQPQMQINSVNPNFASAYDQALGVVKDSPKHSPTPLASFKLIEGDYYSTELFALQVPQTPIHSKSSGTLYESSSGASFV